MKLNVKMYEAGIEEIRYIISRIDKMERNLLHCENVHAYKSAEHLEYAIQGAQREKVGMIKMLSALSGKGYDDIVIDALRSDEQ